MSPEITRRKLALLKQYLSKLEKYATLRRENLSLNEDLQLIITKLLEVIVELAIDINTHLLTAKGASAPKDYHSSFLDLGSNKMIPSKLAKEMAPCAGLRNILVHMYEELDWKLVHGSIRKVLTLFPKYLRAVERHRRTLK